MAYSNRDKALLAANICIQCKLEVSGAYRRCQKCRRRRSPAKRWKPKTKPMQTDFTADQLGAISVFLAQVRDRADIQREEWHESYRSWARGARTWSCVYGFGGTDVRTALWWYQYRHKPGSKEWSPVVIVRALLAASERDYAEPERMAPNHLALLATPADRKKARLAFIRKHGVAAFHQKVNPILMARRRGGVKALLAAPATPETKAYIAILAQIAGREGTDATN